MEILRVPPYSIVASIEVGLPETDYEVSVLDRVDHSTTTETITSDVNSIIAVSLPSDRDGEYIVDFGEDEVIVTVVRPYVDPNTKGTTASEIAEYAKNEAIARAIIDSVIPEGFYYKKHVLKTTGMGSDYIPLWVNARAIYTAVENNVLVYDFEQLDEYSRRFQITRDKSAIVEVFSGGINRYEGSPLIVPMAASDTSDVGYSYRGFPRGFDYEFVLGVGYKTIPSDIVRAAEMLIEDLACGRLEYFKRYIANYDTEQFMIKLDTRRAFDGTGNILVDKILSKYAKSIRTVGVL